MTHDNHNTHRLPGKLIRFDIDPRNPLHMESSEKQSKGRSRGVTNVSPSRSAKSTKTENSTSYHSSGFKVVEVYDKTPLFEPDFPTSSQDSAQQTPRRRGSVESEAISPQDETTPNSTDSRSLSHLSKGNKARATKESTAIRLEAASAESRVHTTGQGDEAPLKWGTPKGTEGETRNSSVRKEGTERKEGPRLKVATPQAGKSVSRRDSKPKDSKSILAKGAENKAVPSTITQESQGPKKKRKDVGDAEDFQMLYHW
ncbi:hypothetical protein BJ165DRAFT_1604902 [Panaeolus papilionaceus]|nr:hypothetical protein BJ165DRAFT_1604902 [Panaeolus papilionaceus]